MDESNKTMMSEEQAVGYMMLACKEIGLPSGQVKKLHLSIRSQFSSYPAEEAEKEGINWLNLIKSKNIEAPRRSLNLVLPEVGESNSTKRLRADNERLIRELKRIENGPLGLFGLFRRYKK